MKDIFSFFWNTRQIKPVFVLLATLFCNILQMMSFVMLLPTITAANESIGSDGSFSDKSNILLKYSSGFMEWLGFSSTLINFFSVMVAFYIAKLFFQYILIFYINFMTIRMQGRLWSSFLINLIDTSWSFFKHQSQGMLIEILNRTGSVSNIYLSCVNMISVIFQFLVILFILGFVSFDGLLFVVAFLGVNFLILKLTERFNMKASDKMWRAQSYLSKKFSDLIVAMKTIKVMGRSDKFKNFFSGQAYLLARHKFRARLVGDSLTQMHELMLFLATICVILMQIFYDFSSSEFIVFIILFLRLSTYLKSLQSYFVIFTSEWPSYLRIVELMDEASAVSEKYIGVIEPVFNREIRFEKLNFSFDNMPILKNVSVSFPKGKTSVLYGPSGSGKTTMIDLVCGLYEVKEGSLFIDNLPMEKLDIFKWRRKIGYVPQDVYLLNANLRENVTLGFDSEVDDAKIWEVLALADLADTPRFKSDGLDTYIGEKGAFLSGGERQRLALARALVFDPEILILDEVTSNLDPQSEMNIYNNIRNLSKSYTIIVVTHRDIWFKMADYKYKVDKGVCTQIMNDAKLEQNKDVV